jgi:diguanylate cyclase (GGDEF)-like protein/PAS domain S-box-containing protein
MTFEIRNFESSRAAPEAAPREGVSRAVLAEALDLMPDAVFFVDAQLRIVAANSPAVGSSGFLPSELVTMTLSGVLADTGGGELERGLARLLRGEGLEETTPARQLTKHGDSFAVQVHLQRVDDDLEPCLVVVVQRAADSREREEWAALDAARDFVTGLPTRTALEQCLRDAERRARRRRRRFAVLFIDLDRFKTFNDASGHRTGDLLLGAVADRLRACMRPGDFVARYGGDEFVAVIEDVGVSEEVQRIADRIRAELGAPLEVEGRAFRISASVGIAIGHPFSSARTLVDEADRAMYLCKPRAAGETRHAQPPQP